MKRIILISIFISLWCGYVNSQTDITIYDATMVDEEPLWVDCENLDKEKARNCWEEHIHKFLNDNLKYPGTCMSYTGKVWIEFIIEKDGGISELKVLKGDFAPANEEAIRVLKLLPILVPAKQNGQPVRCRFRIPISFTLK